MVGYVYIVDEILGDGVLDDKIVEVKGTEQNACYLKILRNLCNKNIAPADAENEFDNQDDNPYQYDEGWHNRRHHENSGQIG